MSTAVHRNGGPMVPTEYHLDPLGSQRLGEMPHRRKQISDLLDVMAHALVGGLDHQHHVCFGIDIAQAHQAQAQLIAEDEAKGSACSSCGHRQLAPRATVTP
jgi:hypothetical protein